MGSLRGREKMVYWYMPLFMRYFLSLFYYFLSFSLSVFSLLLVSYYSPAVDCSPFLVFPFLGSLSLSGCLLLSYHGFPPLKRFPPLGLPLLIFFSLPLFFFSSPVFSSSIRSPFFLLWLPSFCSELIQWDFSLLPLRLHQLFLVCCGHHFKITHPPIGCPDHCHCSVHVCCTATHFTTKFPFVCSCYIPLPHNLSLWHASDGPNCLLLLLGKIPP